MTCPFISVELCFQNVILDWEVIFMQFETDNQMNYILSTFAVEQCRPSEYAIQLCREISAGNISSEQAIDKILERHNLNRSKCDSRKL